jgi:hypothetical protein
VAYFKLQPRNSPGATDENNEDLSQDGQCPDRESNREEPEYKSRKVKSSNTVASYSGDRGLKSRPGDQLS